MEFNFSFSFVFLFCVAIWSIPVTRIPKTSHKISEAVIDTTSHVVYWSASDIGADPPMEIHGQRPMGLFFFFFVSFRVR